MKTLHILGSSDAFNAGGALHSCYLLSGEKERLLLECGPSVLAALNRDKIPSTSIDFLLISHLHGDHFGGLPFLFLEYSYRVKRSTPLRLAGPPGLQERAEKLYAVMYGKTLSDLRFELEFIEVHPDVDLHLGDFTIHPFEVPHNAQPFALGYRLIEGTHTMVFSGDSAWSDILLAQSQGVDLFLCECCTQEPRLKQHISLHEILQDRAKIGAKDLLLTHLGDDMRRMKKTSWAHAHDGLIYTFGAKTTN
ncbi:MAG: MBL fold metallo-hydrolase [Myxococcota bacterium]|nr:MBL fold metallo-hydrolase [Myxococcota bacterium]